MNLKKFFALILALIMVTSLLSACGDDTEGDAGGDAQVGNGDSSEAGGVFYIDGEEIDTENLVMMTINGVEIPFDEFRYTYTMLDNSYFSYGDMSYWEENPDMFPVLLDYTEGYLLENNWGNLLAEKYGIEFTEEDLEEIEAALVNERSYFESDEDFYATLEEANFTEDLLRRLIAQQIMCNRTYDELYGGEGAALVPSDDEIKEDIKDSYVRVYHVLVTYDHFADAEGYEDATEGELEAAALDYAEELLDQIANGADIYELAQTVGDDPGMIDNPDGYFFTYNTMVEAFETAAFALEVGGTSEIVEDGYYGFFIIRRLEQDEYVEENWETVKSDYINTIFNNEVNEMLDSAEIVYSEYYDQITYDSIR